MMPDDVRRLYICGPGDGKGDEDTHLSYVSTGGVFLFCLPDDPLRLKLACEWTPKRKWHYRTRKARLKDAEYWDQFYNEVTCPICLRRASGEPIKFLPLAGVSPEDVGIGTPQDLIIKGSNLDEATEVSFDPGIILNSFSIDSPTQITANITIPKDTELGLRTHVQVLAGG